MIKKYAAIQKRKRLSGWKEEDLTLAFLEQKAQYCWPESIPVEDDLVKSKKKREMMKTVLQLCSVVRMSFETKAKILNGTCEVKTAKLVV